jgi:hypothetical protein
MRIDNGAVWGETPLQTVIFSFSALLLPWCITRRRGLILCRLPFPRLAESLSNPPMERIVPKPNLYRKLISRT